MILYLHLYLYPLFRTRVDCHFQVYAPRQVLERIAYRQEQFVDVDYRYGGLAHSPIHSIPYFIFDLSLFFSESVFILRLRSDSLALSGSG